MTPTFRIIADGADVQCRGDFFLRGKISRISFFNRFLDLGYLQGFTFQIIAQCVDG